MRAVTLVSFFFKVEILFYFPLDSIISASVDIEGELSEAEGYVKAMETYCKNLATDRRMLQQKVTDYKEEFNHLIQKFQNARANAESLALKSGSITRNKLVAGNQKLDQSTLILEETRSVLYETERIGTTIISDLESQKEKIVGAQVKVQETKQFTVDARSILQKMGYKAIYHKICIYFTILLLACVIGIIIYFGFIKKNQ